MASAESSADMGPLLAYIKRTRGFDFTGYKSSTIFRRVQKRMQSVGIESVPAYVDYLEVHPDEFEHLFNTILINVTGFFRDETAWEYIGSEILPRIAADRRAAETIRIWCAGCASGEEAYSLAMMLSEL